MDGKRIAWISGACRTVRIRAVAGGGTSVLGSASRTECDDRGTPMIALAGRRAVWDELTFGNFTYAYVLTRAAGERAPVKQIDYLVHQNDADGEWLTSMAGDGTTLAYADLVVSGKTLPDDTDVYFADRGTVRRVVGRSKRISQAQGPPLRMAAAGSLIGVVYAERTEQELAVLRASQTVKVLDLSGHVVSALTVSRARTWTRPAPTSSAIQGAPFGSTTSPPVPRGRSRRLRPCRSASRSRGGRSRGRRMSAQEDGSGASSSRADPLLASSGDSVRVVGRCAF